MPRSRALLLRRALASRLRLLWRRLHVGSAIFGATVCALLFAVCAAIALAARSTRPAVALSTQLKALRRGHRDQLPENVLLFIAIGSAPGNQDLRAAARDSWLRWLPQDGSVEYKFFSDARPALEELTPEVSQVWDALEAEGRREMDVVLQPLATGYGSNSENAYGQRALYQISWIRERFGDGLSYFLRIDDDSFLCLHRLLYELKTTPTEQFFWGRFWCRDARNRADENFMLFSGDVMALLGDDRFVGRLLPFDDSVTLGWNFGYLSWILNLTMFDDQERLDAQQGYLTDYMHEEAAPDPSQVSRFCDSFLYAHHVSALVITAAYRHTTTRLMYPIPNRTSPRETCSRKDMSFVPARHSRKLPDVKVGLASA